MAAVYSETPLAKKLGIKAGFKLVIHNPPEHYFMLFNDLPEDLELVEEEKENEIDFVHLFGTDFDELKAAFIANKKRIKKNGMIWVSWPKGKSTIPTNIKRDAIREFGLSTGLVDVKVCAVDDDWSGLKFVIRVKDR